MERSAFYKALTPVLLYPSGAYHEQTERCCELLGAFEDPEVPAWFKRFHEATREMSLSELEELYIRTFDMVPASTLDLGWHLFGEDYNRGVFLVRMREQMRRFGIPESRELPDHVSHVLAVLGCMEGEEAADFAAACVIPALRKAREGIPEENPYRFLITGVVRLLESQHGYPKEETNCG